MDWPCILLRLVTWLVPCILHGECKNQCRIWFSPSPFLSSICIVSLGADPLKVLGLPGSQSAQLGFRRLIKLTTPVSVLMMSRGVNHDWCQLPNLMLVKPEKEGYFKWKLKGKAAFFHSSKFNWTKSRAWQKIKVKGEYCRTWVWRDWK